MYSSGPKLILVRCSSMYVLENGIVSSLLIAHPHILVQATSEQFLPAGVTFSTGSTRESHYLQLVLVLTVHCWPAPVCVGGLLVILHFRHRWFVLPLIPILEGCTPSYNLHTRAFWDLFIGVLFTLKNDYKAMVFYM